MTLLTELIHNLFPHPAQEIIDPPKKPGPDFFRALVDLHHSAMQHSVDGVPDVAVYVNDGPAMRSIIQEINDRFDASWPPEIRRYSDMRPVIEEMSNGTTRSAKLCGVMVYWPEGDRWPAMPGMPRGRQS